MTLRWRLYSYTARISSAEKPWEDVTDKDIIAVVWQQPDMEKPSVELGSPYYIHLGDWIARCWDPHLYLRKCGTVKYGRWAQRSIFRSAWEAATMSLYPKNKLQDFDKIKEGYLQGSHVVWTGDAADTDSVFPAWWVYYDNGTMYNADHHRWDEIPSDGIMAACYSTKRDGIIINMAKRRYSFYYWVGDELANTDDLGHVLAQHPMIKYGRTDFSGLKAVMPMAEIYKMALEDTLEDVPWP